MIYTVVPNDPNELSEEFNSYEEAKDFGDEYFPGNYEIIGEHGDFS